MSRLEIPVAADLRNGLIDLRKKVSGGRGRARERDTIDTGDVQKPDVLIGSRSAVDELNCESSQDFISGDRLTVWLVGAPSAPR